MIKFIIIDDEEKFLESIKKTIRKVTFNLDENIEIKEYQQITKELKSDINDLSCQKIYLLDIDLNTKTSGINIAKEIREIDWDSEIIFVTSHDKMFEQVFRSVYKVFDFIEKFYDMDSRLEKDLKKILSKDHDNKMFKYKNRKIELQIYLHDITYISRDTADRKLIINTTFNSFSINMTLEEALKHLDSRFKRVHRACIVNTQKVIEYNWNKGFFKLSNNEEINLLSKKFKEK